ncbi:MAG TPA: hypothetical protein VNW53_14895 [Phenylobacterium sp.]|nr:hypothetical protein [Phenylobacterium sp.]
MTFEQLGTLAEVDGAQAWRICRGDFTTLNPSVLKICNALGIEPEAEGLVVPAAKTTSVEAKLAAEVLAAWDRTEEGARLLTRVLRAFHKA